MSIPFYYRVLRLYASNKNLLKIYYKLYYQLEGEEEIFQKEQISNRIALRERFELEISRYLKENFNNNRSSLINNLIVSCLPVIAQSDYDLQSALSSLDGNLCYDCELDNVNKYYQILYFRKAPSTLTDILLEQRNQVERYLLTEVY